MQTSTPARKKLREAQFFLEHLQDSEGDAHSGPEDSDFYLSAFLSASRSITFVLQSENKTGYDAWFPTWLANRTPKERELLVFLNVQRVRVTHTEGTPERRVAVEIVDVPLTSGGGSFPAGATSNMMGFENVMAGIRVRYFKLGGQDVRAVEVCSMAVELLGDLLESFYAAHPPTAAVSTL